MKTYTYYTNNTTPNFYNKNNSVKDFILNNTIFKKYPYMAPKKTTTFNDFGTYLTKYYTPVNTVSSKPITYTSELLFNSYSSLLPKVAEYLYYTENPTYDFKVDGVPVQIHGSYIIVGSKLIPTNTTGLNIDFFNTMKESEKKTVYNIYLFLDSKFSA